jgi:fibronectin-binding autotransporter adhesin
MARYTRRWLGIGANANGLFPGSRLTVAAQRQVRLGLQPLEDRTVPNTYSVTSAADTGFGTLRSAISSANSNAGADTITFSTKVFTSPMTITLTMGELLITDSVTITGPSKVLTVSGNNASRVFDISAAGTITVTITGLTISHGKAAGAGGGLLNQGKIVTLTNCTISNNTTTTGNSGGGIASVGGFLTLNSCTVTSNTSGAAGGGAFCGSNASVLLNSCTIGNNKTTGLNSGGGVSNVTSTLTLQGCTVSGNSAGENGGGIDGNSAVNVTIRDTTISGNTAVNGAGVSLGSSSIFIERSTLAGNLASNFGGGLLIQGAVGANGATLRNSTFVGNRAVNAGAIGAYQSSGSMLIQNCTITSNVVTTTGFGGGIEVENGGPTFTLESTIVSSNNDADCDNAMIFAKNCALGTTNGAIYTDQGGNIIGANLKLGPLASNGGPTQTVALLAGSPCIDAGSNPAGLTVDQRGTNFPRIVAGVADIGAYESHGLTVDNANDSGPGSLRQAIVEANGLVGTDAITFDATFFATPRTITLTTGELLISDSLTITGPGAALTTLSGNNASRVFDIYNAVSLLDVTLSRLTVTQGKATRYGGGIFSNGENVTIQQCIISNNNAVTSGGMSVSGKLTLTDSQVVNNTATGNIGGFAGTGATTILRSTISGNTAAGSVGGIYVGTSLALQDSTVSGNSASINVGGIVLVAGTAAFNILNSTISGNTAGQNGGGIVLGYSAAAPLNTALSIQNSTIANNKAGSGSGGGIARLFGSASITLESAIVQTNTAATGPDIYSTGTVAAKNTALGSINGITTYTNNGGNLIGKNIMLGPLANNGGSTLTHALLAGSPCIDAGSNPAALTNDQRGTGFPRLISGVADIGAFESGGFVVTNANDSGPGSLRQTILDANAYSGAQTITFDPTVFAAPQTITLTSGEILVSDSATIQGPDAALTTVNGNAMSRVFDAAGPGTITVSISGLTITNGKVAGAGGGVYNAAENLTLIGCAVFNNVTTAGYSGGGIGDDNGGAITLVNCTVTGNHAGYNGGGVDGNGNVMITIQNSTLANNSASFYGGAVSLIGTVSIENSTLSNNTAAYAGALNSYSGGVVIRNCTISDNSATNYGGAISPGGTLLVQNSTITGNSAATKGGGIYEGTAYTVNLESTIIQGNTAANGSDIYTPGTASTKTTAIGSIDGITTFTNLGGDLIGQDIKLGPLANNGGPTLTHALLPGSPCIDAGSNPVPEISDQRGAGFPRVMDGVADMGAFEAGGFVVTNTNDSGLGSLRQTITDANAYSGAQTITFDSAVFATPKTITLTTGEFLISDSVTIQGPGASLVAVSGNDASRVFDIKGSGVIAVTIAGLTVTHGKTTSGSTSGSTTGDGAGIQTEDENVTLDGVVVSNNVSTGEGGGIGVGFPGTLTLRNCTVSGNSAGSAGGGIYFPDNGALLVQNSTISNNTSGGEGGGLYFYGTVATDCLMILNSTISGNMAATNGGGIHLRAFLGDLTVVNTTITANIATSGVGGGIARIMGTGTITVASSIVSGNTNAAAPDISSSGTVNENYSAVGANLGFTPTGGNNLPFGTNLKLGPLANNGGPSMTHALLWTSPAIGAGSNPVALTTDQRGKPRSVGAIDIGAFELQPAAKVSGVVVGDGTNQRSIVTQLTVTFNSPIIFTGTADAAFTLVRQSDGKAVTLAAIVDPTNTMVTLTFAGGAVDNKSLADGRYTLDIIANQIGADGLDGNGDGTGGDDYQLVGALGTAPNLFRLFGDANGDGAVGANDFVFFRQSFNGVNDAFDFDGDGFVSTSDFAQFRNRFNTSI